MTDVTLGEISRSIDYGVTASASLDPVGPKFLRITDIQDGMVHWESVPWCATDVRSRRDALLQSGDIVFARTGATTGKSFLIRECPDDAVFASYLIRVRLNESVDPRYVSQFFQTKQYWNQIILAARGAAQTGVNATTLRAIRVPVVSLPEQRRVAEVLERAEELRAKRRAALALLDSLTESVFLDLFGDPTANSRGWENRRLLDVLDAPLRNGVSPSNGGALQARVLTLSAVTGERFDVTSIKTSTFDSEPTSDKKVDQRDLLICRGNGNIRLVGKGFFAGASMPDVIFPDTIIAARVATERIRPAFLEAVWNSRAVRRQVEALARTTNGTFKVNQTMLEGIVFIAPPLAMQQEFERRLAAVERLRDAYRASLSQMDVLFASLQHRAFRSEL